MATILRGAPVAAALTEDLRRRVQALTKCGVTPTLATVRVGAREDDLAYERGIGKRTEKVGFTVLSFALDADVTQEDLMAVIDRVNGDPSIHGCLMLRPLPAHLDEAAACALLDPAKDVDAVAPSSLYRVLAGEDGGFAPCTAEAVLRILDAAAVSLEGARVTVVGRSLVIGRPVAALLMARNATVTVCHTRTRDLAVECARADIIIAAAGHTGTVTAACVRPGQVVVDVGTNWDAAAGRLVGDVAFDEVEPIVAAITPVPGGVGAVTTTVLASHVIEAAERAAALRS